MATIELSSVSEKNVNKIIEECNAYRQQLIEYCMHYLKVYEDAQDCVSYAYISLVETLEQGTQIASPKAWLYKVAINKAIRMNKENNRRKENDYQDSSIKDDVIENSVSYDPDYVENMIDDNQIARCAVKIIQSLSDDEYLLYDRYYRKNKKLYEIALELKLSPATVRKRHQRLKEKLRTLVDNAEENYYKEGRD